MSYDLHSKAGDERLSFTPWQWRAIYSYIKHLAKVYNKKIDVEEWAYNGTVAIQSPKECRQIASLLSIATRDMTDDNVIYVNLGVWQKEDEKGYITDIPQQYTLVLIFTTKMVSPEGDIIYPAHNVSVKDIKKFIKFLRSCEGFLIM